MEIRIGKTANFKSVTITEGLATIDSGLLDASEANDLAESMIEAAYDLWCAEGETFEEFLNLWLEK